MDPFTIAAIVALIATNAAGGFASEAGTKAWDALQKMIGSLRSRLSGRGASGLAAVEARDAEPATRSVLAAEIAGLANADADFCDALTALLAEVGRSKPFANTIAIARENAIQINVSGNYYGPIFPPSPSASKHPVSQLPFASAEFTGRTAEVRRASKWLTSGGTPRLVNIYGTPGSGKSALALQLGRDLSATYPDCQLYFNLRESDSQQALPADEILAGVLIALGTPATEIPSGLLIRAAAFRSALAGLRSLIIIDNVSGSTEVNALLPGMSECAVLITSWAPISQLPGVHVIPLGALSMHEAMDMLRAVTERPISKDDMPVVRRLVELVGALPLALQIAGGLLKPRDYWSWADLLRHLTEQRRQAKLDALMTGSLSVPDTLNLAYRDLDEHVARGYRLLGLAPSASMNRELALALISADPGHAAGVLDQLQVRRLVQAVGESSVNMHNLIWLNARDLANSAEDAQGCQTAIDRMVRWSLLQFDAQYLPRLKAAVRLLPPASNSRSPLPLHEMYVESGVVVSGNLTTLTSVFPSRHSRLVVEAPGGTGKTTIVNYLCDHAAVDRERGGQSPVPLVVLARDMRAEEMRDGLEPVLLQMLRYRYEVDVPPQALQVALEQGTVFVVLDGLDEVVDPQLRSGIVAAISEFASRYRRTAILITTRPYPRRAQDLPAFDVARIAPWTKDQVECYLTNLAEFLPGGRYGTEVNELHEWVSSNLDTSLIPTTPLSLQLVAGNFYETGHVPKNFTALIEGIVNQIIFRRELARGSLYAEPEELRRALELLAFKMQSSARNRVLITRRALLETFPTDLVEVLLTRVGLFQALGLAPDGEELYALRTPPSASISRHRTSSCSYPRR